MIDSKNLIQRRSLGPITVKLDEKENVVKREMAKLEVAPKEFIQIYLVFQEYETRAVPVRPASL